MRTFDALNACKSVQIINARDSPLEIIKAQALCPLRRAVTDRRSGGVRGLSARRQPTPSPRSQPSRPPTSAAADCRNVTF
jgi:hypothetical protein